MESILIKDTTKEESECIVAEFGYDLSRTLDEIRPDYHQVESCQETVPEAITAFPEDNDFEDVVRNAVSLPSQIEGTQCTLDYLVLGKAH